jgi:hypothetical protein
MIQDARSHEIKINERVHCLENWDNIKGKYLFLISEFEKIGN